MKSSRVFEIAYVGLKEGLHEYQYEIDQRFLDDMGYEGDELTNFNCTINLIFEKDNGFFQLKFDLDGSCKVACDRCGDLMDMQIWDEFKLIIKINHTDTPIENNEDDEVVFIQKSETVIDIAPWIYEFIILSIPIQHVHGDNEQGESLCNPQALKILAQHQEEAAKEASNRLWKGLDKIKKDENFN